MGRAKLATYSFFLCLAPVFLSFGYLEQFAFGTLVCKTIAGEPMVLFPMFVMQCTYFHIYVTAVYVIVWYVSGHT